MRRMATSRILLRLGLMSVSLVVALAAGELILRWRALPAEHPESIEQQLERSARTPLGAAEGRFTLLGLVRPSPVADIVYELKPNQQGVFKGQPVRINNLGMRGPDVTVEKPAGTFRIAGIGDSVMFGWGVGEGEVYSQLVEQRLNLKAGGARHYEFLNFAVPGYNTVMEVSTFEHKVAAFAPDLVVIHFIGNDLSLPHFMAPPPAAAERRFHSYLLDALRARLRAAPDPETARLEIPDLVHAAAELPAGMRRETLDRYAAMTGREAYDRAMQRLAELTRQSHTPVLVMRLGGNDTADDADRGDGEASGRSGRGGGANEDVAGEAARANGFRAFNPAPAFWSYLQRHGLADTHDVWVKTFKIPSDGHPNALGHSIYAEALAGELEAMGVVAH